ncbi:MAG TPA: succinate dehydrogenase, hydrophobic membrane anchor protein [Burkholderiales bacterium]|nr:succinate dehydrogenase, hydrophobic membrane anchor protein [Burkholderiales bacterium]
MKRTLFAAPHGTGHWIAQRLTAVFIVAYTVLFLIALGLTQPAGYDAWRAFFGQGWLRLATMICFLALLYHSWVGMRDILMDYIKPAGLRLALFMMVAIALLAYAGWAAQILWTS